MIISDLKIFLENKNFQKAWIAVIVCLIASTLFFKTRLGFLKKEIKKNSVFIKESLPDFDNQAQTRFDKEIKQLEARLMGFSELFHPKEKWLKQGYDLSILFVEDLTNINQSLKKKAEEKNLNFVSLGFTEKLPSEAEAQSLLGQLYGLKALSELGMDLGINFAAINPQPIEKLDIIPGAELAKSYLELSCPKETLIEFIIQLQDIIPRICLDSLLIQTQDNAFKVSLLFSNILLNFDWKGKKIEPVLAETIAEPFSQKAQEFVSILRSKNPFFVTKPKDISLPAAETDVKISEEKKEEKPAVRFFYRGKAILKEKEVVVIEDSLNKDTVFLGRKEQYDNFKVVDFSEKEVILENINDGNKIFIKREE